jgi:hypothetical protein
MVFSTPMLGGRPFNRFGVNMRKSPIGTDTPTPAFADLSTALIHTIISLSTVAKDRSFDLPQP